MAIVATRNHILEGVVMDLGGSPSLRQDHVSPAAIQQSQVVFV